MYFQIESGISIETVSTTTGVKTTTESPTVTETKRETTTTPFRTQSDLTQADKKNKRKIGISRFRHKIYTYVNADRPSSDSIELKGGGKIINKIITKYSFNYNKLYIRNNQINFHSSNRQR